MKSLSWILICVFVLCVVSSCAQLAAIGKAMEASGNVLLGRTPEGQPDPAGSSLPEKLPPPLSLFARIGLEGWIGLGTLLGIIGVEEKKRRDANTLAGKLSRAINMVPEDIREAVKEKIKELIVGSGTKNLKKKLDALRDANL